MKLVSPLTRRSSNKTTDGGTIILRHRMSTSSSDEAQRKKAVASPNKEAGSTSNARGSKAEEADTVRETVGEEGKQSEEGRKYGEDKPTTLPPNRLHSSTEDVNASGGCAPENSPPHSRQAIVGTDAQGKIKDGIAPQSNVVLFQEELTPSRVLEAPSDIEYDTCDECEEGDPDHQRYSLSQMHSLNPGQQQQQQHEQELEYKTQIHRSGKQSDEEGTHGESSRSRRSAVSVSLEIDVLKKSVAKSDAVRSLILNAIKQNVLFRACSDNELVDLVDVFVREMIVDAGHAIIRQHDKNGKFFYVVEFGMLDVIIDNKHVRCLHAGSAFGEIALLYGCPRTATVRATTDCQLWSIDRRTFRSITGEHRMKRIKAISSLLRNIKCGAHVMGDFATASELESLAVATKGVSFRRGDVVVRQGDQVDFLYIVEEGTVDVYVKNENGQERPINSLGGGQCLGEKALLSSDIWDATIVASSSNARCLVLKLKDMFLLLGDLQDLIHDRSGGHKEKLAVAGSGDRQIEKIEVNYADLEIKRILGIGKFGGVKLVRVKSSLVATLGHDLFALKCLSNKAINEHGLQGRVLNEKQIMSGLNHPFICTFYGEVHHDKYTCFLLEALVGGDLYDRLNENQSGGFPEEWTRFYSASVLHALCHLHEKTIAYRDLKPENLVMAADGYVKIVDFALSKRIENGKTWTFCGTPDYMAPEIILNEGHDWAVDYWALGVLLYELTKGQVPFSGRNPMVAYLKILSGNLTIPESFSRRLADLLRQLLNVPQCQRFGRIKGGGEKVMEHKWFSGFDWDSMLGRRLRAPIVPSDAQIKNDIHEFTDENASLEFNVADFRTERRPRREANYMVTAPGYGGFDEGGVMQDAMTGAAFQARMDKSETDEQAVAFEEERLHSSVSPGMTADSMDPALGVGKNLVLLSQPAQNALASAATGRATLLRQPQWTKYADHQWHEHDAQLQSVFVPVDLERNAGFDDCISSSGESDPGEGSAESSLTDEERAYGNEGSRLGMLQSPKKRSIGRGTDGLSSMWTSVRDFAIRQNNPNGLDMLPNRLKIKRDIKPGAVSIVDRRRLHRARIVFWFVVVPMLVVMWYASAIFFPPQAREKVPALLWTDGAQGRLPDGTMVVCPKPTLCSVGWVEVLLLVNSRLTAYASYVAMALVFLSKMHSTINYMSHTYVATVLLPEFLHPGHKVMGVVYFALAFSHTATHLLRWAIRGELSTMCGTRAGVSGIISMVLMCFIVLAMAPMVKARVAFERRLASHWFFLPCAFVLCFHAKRVLIITGIFVGLWVIDYLYGVVFRTWRLDVVELVPLEGSGVQMLWRNPYGFKVHSGEYVQVKLPWLQHGGKEWHPFSVYLREATKEGLQEVQRKKKFLVNDRAVDTEKTAILLVEIQNEFASEGGKLHDRVSGVLTSTEMLQKLADLCEEARAVGAHVIHAPITFSKGFRKGLKSNKLRMKLGILGDCYEGDLFTEGSWNAQIVDAIQPKKGDFIVRNNEDVQSFPGREVKTLAEELGITALIVGGFLTNSTLESTMSAAMQMGMETIILTDGCAVVSEAEHVASMQGMVKMSSLPMTCQQAINSLGGEADDLNRDRPYTVVHDQLEDLQTSESKSFPIFADEKSTVVSRTNDGDMNPFVMEEARRYAAARYETTQIFVMPAGDWSEGLNKEVRQRPQLRSCWVRGPFTAPFGIARKFSQLVLFASGIGITPALGVMGQYPGASRTKIFIWSTRSASMLKFFAPLLTDAHLALIYYTGKQRLTNAEVKRIGSIGNIFIQQQRPNLVQLLKDVILMFERNVVADSNDSRRRVSKSRTMGSSSDAHGTLLTIDDIDAAHMASWCALYCGGSTAIRDMLAKASKDLHIGWEYELFDW